MPRRLVLRWHSAGADRAHLSGAIWVTRRAELLAGTAVAIIGALAPAQAAGIPASPAVLAVIPAVAAQAAALDAKVAVARARLGYDRGPALRYAEPAQYFPWRNVQQFPNFPNFPNFANTNFQNFPNFPNFSNF